MSNGGKTNFFSAPAFILIFLTYHRFCTLLKSYYSYVWRQLSVIRYTLLRVLSGNNVVFRLAYAFYCSIKMTTT